MANDPPNTIVFPRGNMVFSRPYPHPKLYHEKHQKKSILI